MIMLEEIGVIGNIDDTLTIGDGSFLVVLQEGSCVVGPTDRSGELLVFDGCRGQPRLFGRVGEGPGELGEVRSLVPWHGDSLVAFGYGQMTVLSGTTGAGRTIRFDPAVQGYEITAVIENSSVIVNNAHRSGFQFTAIRSDGSTGMEFGLPPTPNSRADPRARSAVLGLSPRSGQFWVGTPFYRHHLELWNHTGRSLLTIERTPSWFTPYDSTELYRFWATGGAGMRPLPYLRSIHETPDGLVWATFAVPARDWSPDQAAGTPGRTRNGEAPTGSRTGLKHYDGVIEVLDHSTGELMASIWTDDLWVGFGNDTIVYSRREHSDGTPQLALYRVRLQR